MINKRNIIIFILIIACVFCFIILFFAKNNYKNINTGNNNSKKTLDECEEYIYNISSYEAVAQITVQSNKNTNKYLVKQVCNKDQNTQEIIEPDNLKGIKITYKDKTLILENTSLNLKKLYKDYPYIEENSIFLMDFIAEYKKNKEMENTEIEIENEEIIYKIKTNEIYMKQKMLYLDKKTGTPTKMIVQDNNQKNIIYILYKEIKFSK